MPRIRTIKPEFWGDEKLAPLRPIDRLVFLGLISMADDAGRLVDSIRTIDGFLFPHTEDSAADSLQVLDDLKRIQRGVTASGQKIIQLVNWRHQKIDKPNPKACLPQIDDVSTTCRRRVDDVSTPLTSYLLPPTSDLRSTTPTSDQTIGSVRVSRKRKTNGLTKDTLQDTQSLFSWLEENTKKIGLNFSHGNLINTLGAAERAVEIGDNPPALFQKLLKMGAAGNWSNISGEQMDRAKLRMRAYSAATNRSRIPTNMKVSDAEAEQRQQK